MGWSHTDSLHFSETRSPLERTAEGNELNNGSD